MIETNDATLKKKKKRLITCQTLHQAMQLARCQNSNPVYGVVYHRVLLSIIRQVTDREIGIGWGAYSYQETILFSSSHAREKCQKIFLSEKRNISIPFFTSKNDKRTDSKPPTATGIIKERSQ